LGIFQLGFFPSLKGWLQTALLLTFAS
jgi:hypothetical protein